MCCLFLGCSVKRPLLCLGDLDWTRSVSLGPLPLLGLAVALSLKLLLLHVTTEFAVLVNNAVRNLTWMIFHFRGGLVLMKDSIRNLVNSPLRENLPSFPPECSPEKGPCACTKVNVVRVYN